jgi:hypothetical protein
MTPGCEGLSYGFAAVCSCCGEEFPRKNEEHDGELSRLVIAQNDAAAKVEAKLRKKLHRLRKQAFRTGKDPGWSSKMFFVENRTPPKTAWHCNAVFPEPSDADVQAYALYLENVRARRGLDHAWFELRMQEEFGDTIDWQAALEEAQALAVL